mmetsp:Transcript_5176/g.7271  ORF Transcript_5176/g.7271 Transcript_5176/m.7271 type:complete len:434 (+) Transcript_5176:65-1366(+)|eukprot:CAMPEP_0184504226 /NCGR_PEP_ID=MMETSP0113_2-20130426/52350_1 /TAXON_ID=91329 /ORGANISM="Norrisiella sphaerica, Strain BC52" /LENGTH=433 /DNA_ID=CAMNT_0026893851 /DNA_START=1009 /DNA_END=2313 /DNA_ORIENTATION=-
MSLIVVQYPMDMGQEQEDMERTDEQYVRHHYTRGKCDKVWVPDYDVSAILFLSDQNIDHQGGAEVFEDVRARRLVEAKRGRLICFSSGYENLHRVQPIRQGVRVALEMYFTSSYQENCDKEPKDKSLPYEKPISGPGDSSSELAAQLSPEPPPRYKFNFNNPSGVNREFRRLRKVLGSIENEEKEQRKRRRERNRRREQGEFVSTCSSEDQGELEQEAWIKKHYGSFIREQQNLPVPPRSTADLMKFVTRVEQREARKQKQRNTTGQARDTKEILQAHPGEHPQEHQSIQEEEDNRDERRLPSALHAPTSSSSSLSTTSTLSSTSSPSLPSTKTFARSRPAGRLDSKSAAFLCDSGSPVSSVVRSSSQSPCQRSIGRLERTRSRTVGKRKQRKSQQVESAGSLATAFHHRFDLLPSSLDDAATDSLPSPELSS